VEGSFMDGLILLAIVVGIGVLLFFHFRRQSTG
jgi:hypothetical protein